MTIKIKNKEDHSNIQYEQEHEQGALKLKFTVEDSGIGIK
jgi:hypothetical protein